MARTPPRGEVPAQLACLQHVDRTVEAGTFAVPNTEYAIDLGAGKQPDLLAAPHRGRGKILIEARLEANVVLFEKRLCLPERVIVTAERRTAVAGNEARSIQPRRTIAFALHHRQAHQRLNPRQIDTSGLEGVFILQARAR